ncbi:helix-turn-helix domain-containing protein [Amycolatopsis sp. 195334CR]|uniref:helix-turn-helix domain-containing protein n=1 Tax=Amycolatopsis sp. 195334CR TaxID=2814588 RepID=UPI001A8DB99B|nr:helix-turn-helix transcriptional regulator [Amycolatopsis sp. 195334CR]MBN6040068.1 helix-turn-helix transcriptional regulator [Amycolatopsis sp. 195334CR]
MTEHPDNDADKKAQRELAERLRISREYAGLSQRTVAANTGIPRSAISDIERGARRVDSLELKKLAVVYNQSVEYLLGQDAEARADDPSLTLLTRAHAGLTTGDQEKVLAFAQFLRFGQSSTGTGASTEGTAAEAHSQDGKPQP